MNDPRGVHERGMKSCKCCGKPADERAPWNSNFHAKWILCGQCVFDPEPTFAKCTHSGVIPQ